MDAMYEYASAFLVTKPRLVRLLALVAQAQVWENDLFESPNIEDKFIGDWEDVAPGDNVIVTFIDPYRVEKGFLFTLPDLGPNFLEAALVQIPNTESDQETTRWFTLSHLACIAETIELEKTL